MEFRHVFFILTFAMLLTALIFSSWKADAKNDIRLARLEEQQPQQQQQHLSTTPAGKQRALNAISRDAWALFENHRRHTTQAPLLFANQSSTQSRLVVLGAGNCNDLSLPDLLSGFASVHLCDIDKEALVYGVEKQLGGTKSAAQVSTHVADITGIFPLINKLGKLIKQKQQQQQQQEQQLMQTIMDMLNKFNLREFSVDFKQGFDVVLSSSVLSQVIVSMPTDMANSQLASMIQIQVRDAHLRTMVGLLKRGGVGVLITDFVSTETYSPLWSMEDSQLTSSVLNQLLVEKNFFTGCHPNNIIAKLRSQDFVGLIENVSLASVWKWSLSITRQYAVAAITFSKI